MNLRLVFLSFGLIVLFSACTKDKPENWKTIKELHKSNEDARISSCKYDGATVYTVELNAYDAGTVIYNAEGNQIGSCNYAWGSVDQACNDLEDCEVIYCPEDNIWGHSAVDKYGLK